MYILSTIESKEKQLMGITIELIHEGINVINLVLFAVHISSVFKKKTT